MGLSQAFTYREGQLFCEGIPLRSLAHEFGTPCYVYSKKAIRENFQSFGDAFRAVDPLICYAIKANSNLAILRLLKEEGSGFDVVSAGELHRLRKIGADPKKIIFSGVGKSLAELQAALEMSLFSVNVESLPELRTLAELARSKNLQASVSLRINPDVDANTHPYVATGFRQHKFGFDLSGLEEALALLKNCAQVRLVGLGFHIGSQILDIQPFLDAFGKLKALAQEFQNRGLPIQHLDLGGGIGIPYKGEPEPDLKRYAEFLEKHRGSYEIVFEPGRYIVGNAGALLTQVFYHKVSYEKHFVIVDGAMNDLLRPALYGAYHEILPLLEKAPAVSADVVGPVCETGDFLARDRRLPDLKRGDYLAVMTAGAYGFVAASNYNSRPRPPEILVDGQGTQLIRRRETLEDLTRGEE